MIIKREFNYKILLSIVLFNITFSYGQHFRSVVEWEEKFQRYWKKEYSIARKQSTSNDSWQFYNLAYSIDANTAIYRATKKTIYLDRALLYIDDLITSATVSFNLTQSQYKDSYCGWVNHSAPSLGDDGKEYALFESYCWRYVTSLLYVMHTDSLLQANINYKKKYDSILSFTQKHIFEKWMSRGGENIYRSNTHMFSHWARIAADLYLITDKKIYKEVVDKFVTKFTNHITIRNDTIAWKASWSGAGDIQDVGYGNAVVATVIDFYEKKIAFTEFDIQQLLNAFNNKIWPKPNKFSERIDGTGNGSGWFTDGYIKLGRFSVQLQKRIEKHNKGRSTQFFGNAALNAYILLQN